MKRRARILPAYMGQGLRIDLSTRTGEIVPLDEEMAGKYLGGRGFGVFLVKNHITKDPFDPDMPLVFSSGPLNNTGVYAAGRGSVISRSPLTGTIFDACFGGTFAHHLKRAGFDYLYIHGKSAAPVVVKIENDNVTFLPANDLWGKITLEAHDILKRDGATAVIGPAGENRVLFANIAIDGRYFAGRGGLGAVMGDKKLKGIVVTGDKRTRRAHPKRIEAANKDILRLFKASPILYGPFGIRRLGTPTLVDVINARRMMPTGNFRETYFQDARQFSGIELEKLEKKGLHGCYACPIQCKKNIKGGHPIILLSSIKRTFLIN